MDPKRIKLLKEYDGNPAGSILEISEEAEYNVLKTACIAIDYSATDEAAQLLADQKNQTSQDSLMKNISKEFTRLIAESASKDNGIKINVQVDPEKKEKAFECLGEQLQAVRAKATGNISVDQGNRLDSVTKAALGNNELVDTEGGFLVQQDFQDDLFQVTMDTAVLASRVNTVQVAGNGIKWNELAATYTRTAGSHAVEVYWAAEASSVTASTPKFNRREMQLEKMMGNYYATDEMMEDAPALSGMVSGWFQKHFGFKLDGGIYAGTGAGQMKGIMNSDALVTVAKETSQTAATVVAANVVKMFSRFQGNITSSVWLINPDVFPQLPLMTIGDQPIFVPPGGFSEAPYGTLLGRPILPFEHCETLGTKGDIALVDPTEYLMIQKGGIKSASSMHVQFLTEQMAFRYSLRVNGDTKWSDELTPAKGSATRSPYVVLAVRA